MLKVAEISHDLRNAHSAGIVDCERVSVCLLGCVVRELPVGMFWISMDRLTAVRHDGGWCRSVG